MVLVQNAVSNNYEIRFINPYYNTPVTVIVMHYECKTAGMVSYSTQQIHKNNKYTLQPSYHKNGSTYG